MRDVSAGRLKPPQWVIDPAVGLPLERIRGRCRGISLIELRTVLPFAERALSALEKERFQRLGEPRRRSYLAARLACKRLYRTLRGNDVLTPASDITTLCPDQVRPCCPLDHDDSPVSCSVSHDDRFGVAAAGDRRVGVDVERVSERVLKSRHLYMNESEQRLVQEAALGEIEAAMRIWTLKEAVAKAFDIPLAESWNRVGVVAVGPFESSFQLDGEELRTAVHDEADGHLFTLVCDDQ
jgi:phosphopantetheinyl transferase